MVKFESHGGFFESEAVKCRFALMQGDDKSKWECTFEPISLSKLSLLILEIFEKDSSICELKFRTSLAETNKANESNQECSSSMNGSVKKTAIETENSQCIPKSVAEQSWISVPRMNSTQEILDSISNQLMLGA